MVRLQMLPTAASMIDGNRRLRLCNLLGILPLKLNMTLTPTLTLTLTVWAERLYRLVTVHANKSVDTLAVWSEPEAEI